jgi:HK97 family phage major capsid protein
MSDMQKYVARLIADAARAKSAAEQILDTANMEGRTMTPEEQKEFDAHLGEARKWKSMVDAEKATMAFRKQIEELGGGDPILSDAGGPGEGVPANPSMSLGELFTKSGVFQALKSAKVDGRVPEQFKTQAVRIPYGFKVAASPLLESAATSLYGDGTTAGPVSTLIPGVFTPGLVQMRPTIADLLPVVPITLGNTAVWRIAKNRTVPGSGDEPVPEGTTKPVIAYEFDVVAKQLEKYAAYTKLSEEYLEDDAAVVAFINSDMPFQIRQIEESKLSDALYDSTSDATSLATGSTIFDEVLAAMTEISEAGGDPNGMIITPTNWAEMLAGKFGTGAGDKGYVGGGPFGSTGNPWGLRVVISNAAHDDHPLIGDFSQGAKLFRKGALAMSATNSNEDDFLNNLVAIRAEMREILGKQYPEWFVSADLT